MKVGIQQYLGENHSWSVVGQNLARGLIQLGHEVELASTNGYKYFPADLISYRRTRLDGKYDMQLSYTAMRNFGAYLSNGTHNRFGIWCYEWPILPTGFAKYHIFADKILAPSKFAKDVFLRNKIPEDKVVVIPHGVDLEEYSNTNKYKLKTDKKTKFLINIGQPHLRKNIEGALEAWGRAFTKQDDVCLVAKISIPEKFTQLFEVDPRNILNSFKKKHPNHAEIELITHYVPNIIELYNACDVVYTMSHCEGFYMPGLEALLTNKLNIAPRYGGQLDFLNDDNSLLVNGKIDRANPKSCYWNSNLHNTWFVPNVDDGAAKLREAINKKPIELVNKEMYSWKQVITSIVELVK